MGGHETRGDESMRKFGVKMKGTGDEVDGKREDSVRLVLER